MMCYDCPRMCGVDRESAKGFCGEKKQNSCCKDN